MPRTSVNALHLAMWRDGLGHIQAPTSCDCFDPFHRINFAKSRVIYVDIRFVFAYGACVPSTAVYAVPTDRMNIQRIEATKSTTLHAAHSYSYLRRVCRLRPAYEIFSILNSQRAIAISHQRNPVVNIGKPIPMQFISRLSNYMIKFAVIYRHFREILMSNSNDSRGPFSTRYLNAPHQHHPPRYGL